MILYIEFACIEDARRELEEFAEIRKEYQENGIIVIKKQISTSVLCEVILQLSSLSTMLIIVTLQVTLRLCSSLRWFMLTCFFTYTYFLWIPFVSNFDRNKPVYLTGTHNNQFHSRVVEGASTSL